MVTIEHIAGPVPGVWVTKKGSEVMYVGSYEGANDAARKLQDENAK